MPGVILILIGFFIGAVSDVFRRLPNQKSTMGEVVSIEREKTIDSGRTRYTAYVEYYVSDTAYTIKSRYKSSTFHTGQTLRVVYNQDAPEIAIVRPGAATYLAIGGFIIGGLAVCYYVFFI